MHDLHRSLAWQATAYDQAEACALEHGQPALARLARQAAQRLYDEAFDLITKGVTRDGGSAG